MRFTRNCYWLFRLAKISWGKNPQLAFPIKVEGSGSIRIGNNCKIERYAELGIASTASATFGNNFFLETEAVVLVSKNHQLTVGNDFKLGRAARLYVQNNWQFGHGVKIETNCAIFARESDSAGKFIIGNGSHIGDFTIVDLVNDVIIGEEVAIGPNCTFYTHDHGYADKKTAAWKGQLVSKPILIGDGAWIGSNVTILPGVTIGSRAVVAAGSVVTKSIEPETIWGGVPAKLIKRIS